jgi:hypothetical protein
MQCKASPQSRLANAAEKRHTHWIKQRGECITGCGRYGVIAHHCEGAMFKHNKIQVGHWFVIGLCEYCDSLITDDNRRSFRAKFGPQCELWLKQLAEYPRRHECPPEIIEAIADWQK